MIHNGETYSAIVVGGNHVNSLTMIRCFGKFFDKVLVVLHGCAKCNFSSSRYIERVSYATNEIDLVNILNDYSRTNHCVVITCSDWSAHVLDAYRDQLSPSLLIFQTETKGGIDHYMNKWNQIGLAKECGMKVPNSEFVPENTTGNFERFSFPCIVKPLYSWMVGKNVRICQSEENLKEALSNVDNGGSIVQSLVNKKHEIVVPGFSVGDCVFLPGIVRKIRDVAGGTTYSRIIPFGCEHERLKHCVEKMISSMSYRGCFGVECIFDGDDYVFIEVNLRNDATFYTMYKAGFDIPRIYCEALLSKDASSIEQSPIQSIYAMSEISDFVFVFRKQVSLFGWWKELRKSSCKYVWDSNDIRLCVSMWCEYFRGVFVNKWKLLSK